MKKALLSICGIVALVIVIIALVGMYKFNYLASQDGYDVDGNNIEVIEEGSKTVSGEMTLTMRTWKWVSTSYNNDTELVPNSAEAFSLSFDEDGSVAIGTDCNAMRGSYTLDGNIITFGPILSTRMYCEGSQEQEFAKMLEEVHSYFFTNDGALIFDLKFDSGSSVFR